MNRISPGASRVAARLAARAMAVTGAYVVAAVAMLLTVILLREIIAPSLLRDVLGFIFVASLAAGLEPGTVKAAALGDRGGQEGGVQEGGVQKGGVQKGGVEGVGLGVYVGVGAIKGLLASPFLAIVWWVADPTVPPSDLAWLPLIAIAGFCATDLRVLLDLRGRHAMAIGLKQGSLAGGVVLVGLLVALKAPLFWAIGVSTLARVALLALPSLAAPSGQGQRARPPPWRQARRMLRDPRWMDLAAISVIAAAGGSMDRVFGLRLLRARDYGAYYLTYEVFTKFWLLPYMMTPILFARQVQGEAGRAFTRGAWGVTALAGLAFLALVAGALRFVPNLLERLIGESFGLATLAFAGAVVVGAFSQLRVAELQGAHRSRQVVLITGLSAVLSIPLFWLSAGAFGARGLLLAGLVKSAGELAGLMWGGRRPPIIPGPTGSSP